MTQQVYPVNSREWWEDYLAEQWDLNDGGGQTRHFMECLIANLDIAELNFLRLRPTTILDWGCAFGEGVELLAQSFPQACVSGLDYAERAIEEAQRRHPQQEFICTPDGEIPRVFDCIVTSNCLEHFAKPLQLATDHLRTCKYLYVALVPYDEYPLCEYHRSQFREESFPEKLGKFVRLYAKQIDVNPQYWFGQQLLVVYGSPDYLAERSAGRARDQESEKWEQYYADLPLTEDSEPSKEFHQELIARIGELLPPGSKTLEAGCGGGWQSLALAKAGYRVSLLDFSPNALDYARRLFVHEEQQADFIFSDAFTTGPPQYDLVFNAGALEHYSFDQQVAFLRAMASRSHKYVLVLVPNRLCYWYWLWRVQKAGHGAWPFGKEMPLIDLSAAFEAAGLHFLGEAFMGEGWTKNFINSLTGLEPELRDEILAVHRTALIPTAQKNHLLAALGSVSPAEKATNFWTAPPSSEPAMQVEMQGALADALALRVNAEHSLHRLRAQVAEQAQTIAALQVWQQAGQMFREQLAEKEKILQSRDEGIAWLRDELNALGAKGEATRILKEQLKAKEQTTQNLQKQLRAKEETTQALQEQLRAREQTIQTLQEQLQVDEGIAWLRRELAALQAKEVAARQAKEQASQVFQKQLQTKEQTIRGLRERVSAKKRAPLPQFFAWLALQSGYWRFRKTIRQLIFPFLPKRVRQFIHTLFQHSQVTTRTVPAAKPMVERRPPLPTKAKVGDLFETLTLLPHLPEEKLPAILSHNLPAKPLKQADVICFSIIDWEFRYQRPQQIMSQFAAQGHRVFYISTSRFLPQDANPRFAVRTIKENVYEVQLAAQYQPDVYGGVIEGVNQQELLSSLAGLRRALQIDEAIGYVMIASWGRLALEAQEQWDWRIIYDCMDEWENFPGIKRQVLEMETQLVKQCDLLVVTALRLYEKWQSYKRPMVLARNAVDYNFYAQRCLPNSLLPNVRHPVVGYYGAIADWFDLELMAYVAAQRPAYTFVLLGGVFDVDVAELKKLPNVRLLGQQPYETMPQYLYHFDACIIPFKINPITEATDPVKLYEYLSGGKPVVSVMMPELKQYSDYVYLAADKEDFVNKLDAALSEDSAELCARRKELARQNAWEVRYQQIKSGVNEITPRASIIIVTYNNLVLNKLCLESLIRNTEYHNYELIIVDNNSTDGTPEYLLEMAKQYPSIQTILNPANHGFARANNQGIEKSTGEYIVLLNNDTIVPPGWLGRLLRHLQDPAVGLVGPVTNFVGNEAKVNAPYRTWAEMEAFAQRYTWEHDGQIADIHMLAMFCVAMRRDIYLEIGPLDEQFGVGMFEDDDYSLRLKAKGYRVICAADVFVHHFGQAAFGKLIQSGDYNQIFDENRRYYESKWNIKWTPHQNASLKFEAHYTR